MNLPLKIRVAIVDDHQVIRTSWKILFSTDDRFDVVSVLKSGQEAIDLLPGIAPDVVLMDINMFPINGFEAAEQLARVAPDCRIIGISANNYPGYAKKMLSLGARGFVTKSSTFEELTRAVTRVHMGDIYVCDEISQSDN
ncbi:MAG: response regulator transcription factor [Chitinophagaceae bacterium]